MTRLSTLFFILISTISYGQENLTDSLYQEAFRKFESQIPEYYTKYSVGDAAFQNIYVQENRYMSVYPDTIHGRAVIVLTSKNYAKHYRQNGGKLIQVEIRAIQTHQDRLGIAFIPYHGSLRKKKEVDLYLTDWTNVYFRFNSESEKWEFDHVENAGI